MKNVEIWLVRLGVLLVILMSPTLSAAEEDPYLMLEKAAGKAFDSIKEQQALIEQNPEILRDIVKTELLPYTDYKFAGAKVLGKQFKSVPREKLSVFFDEFKQYLVATFAGVLTLYQGQTVTFEPSRRVEGAKNVTVRAVIVEKERPDIKVAFKVRYSKKTKQWRVWDMEAEGISLVNSKSSEFQSVLRREGIDKIISIMREKNNQKIKLNRNV